MPGFSIEVSLKDINAVNKQLDGKRKLASDLRRPFKRFAIYYGAVVQRTFRDAGRPPGKWPPLSEYTLALRKWRKRGANPKRMLDIHGVHGLKGSFSAHIEPQGMKYGTTVPYAVKHQKGGKTIRPEVTIKAKKGKALKFNIGGAVLYRTKVTLPAREFKVPKREMITWLPRDNEELERLMEGYMRQ